MTIFEQYIHERQFETVLFPVSTDELLGWISTISDQSLIVLNHNDSDLDNQIYVIGQSGCRPTIAIKNIFTVGEYGSILPRLKQVGVNFDISQIGDYGVVTYHG